MKKIITKSLLLAGLFFMIGFFNKYHLPKIKQWILITVEKQTEKHSPIRAWAQSLDLNLLPFRITFHDVKLLPQKGFEQIMAPTTVKEVSIQLNTLSLFKGQIEVAEIRLKESDINIILREKKNSPTNTTAKIPFTFEEISQFPIQKIQLDHFKVNTRFESEGISSQIDNLNLVVENKFNTIRANIDIEKVKIKKTGEDPVLDASLHANFLLDEFGIYFSNLKITRDNSFLEGAGSISGDILKAQVELVRAKIKGDLNLKELRRLIATLDKTIQLPEVSGRLNFDSDIDYKKNKSLNANLYAQAEELKINQYDIGEVIAKGQSTDKKLHIQKANIKNKFGNINIENSELNYFDNMLFRAVVSSTSLELNQLLKSIGLQHIPVFTHFSGKLPCSGNIKNDFKLKCSGELIGQDFAIKNENEKLEDSIVAFKDFKLIGDLTVDSKQVTYKTDVEVGHSKGKSEGVINYQTGFNINYDTPALDTKQIQYLVGLRPEGILSINGKTSGDSQSATLTASAAGDKLWLYDYELNKAKFDIAYKKGILSFSKIDGLFTNSNYHGNLNIDVYKKNISAEINASAIDAEDLLHALSRKVTLPFKVRGNGAASIKINGPLKFNELSYNLKSNIYRGAIADESFDEIRYNIESNKGFVKTKSVFLKKSNSLITLDGTVHPTGIMDLNLLAKNFRIEQSENIQSLKMNMTGTTNFKMKLTNHILQPNFDLKGEITQASMSETSVPDSYFHFKLLQEIISGDGQFFGNALKGSFELPLDKKQITHVQATADNWNFAQSFAIFAENFKSENYQAALTGKLELSIPNNNPRKFTGETNISQFLIQYGKTEMHSPKPFWIFAKNGIITTSHSEIIGDNTFIKLKSESSANENLNLILDGRIDLSIATLFLPFLDDIRGVLKFSFSTKGAITSPEVSGSAYLENGLFKIKGFPHPLEQVNADAFFNNTKIVINSAHGRIANGIFNSGGQIKINNLTDIAVDVHGQFNDSKFNVPDGFQTRGSGDFFIKGSWFPYTIGVNYNVDSGLIENKSTVKSTEVKEIRASSFLPKFLSANRTSPIRLELNVNLKKNISVNMTISRAIIKTELNGQLKIEGPPLDLQITGKVYTLKGGKVTFRNNTFEIQSGTVSYEHSTPTNPTLNMRANAKVTANIKSNETRDYDIDLIVRGTAREPKITVSSVPALAENELISLLTLGFIHDSSQSANSQEITAGDQLANTSYQLGSAFLNEQLGINRVLESRLGIQFDINSSYDTADKAEKHKFTLRKQWTPKFGTTASREIGKNNTNNVKAELKLNKNMSVIGEWEGHETSSSDPTTATYQEQNIFGLDIEYKVEFK